MLRSDFEPALITDSLPPARAIEQSRRGRPRKPDAQTNAQRQARWRERRKAKRNGKDSAPPDAISVTPDVNSAPWVIESERGYPLFTGTRVVCTAWLEAQPEFFVVSTHEASGTIVVRALARR
ncbi:hypothetical protein BN2475_40093 [Paraburkholderia ribeironis]|uniref:Uncharacterized protein n=1 Tax=Paraburkholderia ribeironis TaxID=1247936 RepID=A0A1N7RJK8_9BURK|nr:hypothetical protein BN2475_40093 [Paraburkholderia ribeironis]